jgi:hypothetical protein
LEVARDAEFTDLTINRTGDSAVQSNAWESEMRLENDTTYYWRVKALSDKSFGAWSPVNVFTTEAAPVTTVAAEKSFQAVLSPQPAQQQPQSTPSVIMVQLTNNPQAVTVNVNLPPGILYGIIGLLGIIGITLLMLVVITIKRR